MPSAFNNSIEISEIVFSCIANILTLHKIQKKHVKLIVLCQKSVGTIHCQAKSCGVTPVWPMLEMAYRIVSRTLNFLLNWGQISWKIII